MNGKVRFVAIRGAQVLIAQVLIALSTLGLVSCATPYKSPVGEPTATLALRSSLGAGRAGLIYDDAQCSRPQYLATFESNDRAVVAAGKPIWLKQSFNTVGLPFGRYCEALVTFTPQENAAYAVDFILNAAGCASHVVRIDPSGAEFPELSATPFSHPKCTAW